MKQVQLVKRTRRYRSNTALDLRTPSGRTLPY